MSRPRKRLVAGLSVVAVLTVLAVPAVHWRLVGWAKREPFYQGRPAGYWAAELRTLKVYSRPAQRAVGPGPGETYPIWMGWRPADRRRVAWVRERLGWDYTVSQVFEADLPLARPDPSAAPVLRSLSADPDEGVSGWAKHVLS